MATLPAYFRRTDTVAPAGGGEMDQPRARNPFELRKLPHEDVLFLCKRIDNSRLVREPDPKAPSACWSAIGVAALAVALIGGVLLPNMMSTLAGYQLEKLRAEERSLIDERHNLEWQEAQLLNVNRLERLATDRNLTPPAPGPLVHLNGKDSSVAMMQR